MTILGLHRITLGCADAQRTVDFYVTVRLYPNLEHTICPDEIEFVTGMMAPLSAAP